MRSAIGTRVRGSRQIGSEGDARVRSRARVHGDGRRTINFWSSAMSMPGASPSCAFEGWWSVVRIRRSCRRGAFSRRGSAQMKIREGAVGSSTYRAVLAGELLDLLLGIFEGRHVVDLFDLGCHVVGSCACGERAKWRRGGSSFARESRGVARGARRSIRDAMVDVFAASTWLAGAPLPVDGTVSPRGSR